MSEVDELDVNPFFKALQGKFLATYERAQEECYLLCIPQSECLHGALITEKFVDTHILKPSPFFKGQYTTLLSQKQVVSIDDAADYVCTMEGFPTRTKIKIISEELGYNKAYKPYKILITARPLDHNLLRHTNFETGSSSGEFKLKFTVKEEFLRSFPEFSKSLKEFDEQIQKFLKSYIILKDYLHEAAQRLNDIAISTSQKCLKSLKDRKLCAPKFQDNMTAAVETCLIGSVHQKLYPVVCSKCADENSTMLTKCHKLQGLTPEHLGVPKHFCCPVTSASRAGTWVEPLTFRKLAGKLCHMKESDPDGAQTTVVIHFLFSVVELAHLDGLVTPIEKLYCLKTTIDNITEEINKNVRASKPLGVLDEDLPCLTSDELLPILVTVLVQAKCNHIHSDIYYIDNFYWSATNKDTDTLSYCLVTFKAAVQYLMTTDFSDIDLNTLRANEISFQELVKVGIASENKNVESLGTSKDKDRGGYAPSRSRFERQMDNITKMLEESTKDMKPVDDRSVGQPIVTSIFGGKRLSVSPLPDDTVKSDKQEKKEDMGDFLSSLQNDMFLSFGKQS